MPGLKGPTVADDHQEDCMNACMSTAADRGVREGNENGNFLSLFVSDASSLSNVQLRPLLPSLTASGFVMEPPRYVTRMPGGVGGGWPQGPSLSRLSAGNDDGV